MARRVAQPGQARGKRYSRFSKGGFTFETDAGFESKLLLSDEVLSLITTRTAELAGRMVKEAPRGPHVTTDEFSIKRNIHPYVEKVGHEWVGYIVIEENEKARHAMLQEQGYRDPAGRRHRGRFYLKKVLESERVD
ncbi:hypothetical protein HKX69_05830 [Streptomyces argyrophyllae]|uniref:HK97 gp10 family phage protein n=1 Tax=Streptomyces argyrophylli TaxID=2726118 RepID=A0A6M4PEG5_9ACTN|nr:hypothetical protein [Streptomyces argyrophyllae]QJS09097.1 hypothetical protein HKX69_05830 [Streptomyces argyrophyllae]